MPISCTGDFNWNCSDPCLNAALRKMTIADYPFSALVVPKFSELVQKAFNLGFKGFGQQLLGSCS
jgi:hypothetical protein